MKNIRNIAFYFIMLTAAGLRGIQASEQLVATAKQLTKKSYTSQQMQQNAVLFIHDNCNVMINKTQQLPSAEDILTKVSQLQDSNGIIQDAQLKSQAIKALNAAIKATENAILVAQLQAFDFMKATTDTEHAQLIEILIDQKIALESKIAQLNRKSLWLFLSKPSTRPFLIAAGVIVIATGTTHYYNLYIDMQKSLNISNLPIVAHPLQGQELLNPTYQELKTLISDFIDYENIQNDIPMFSARTSALLQKLDPLKDKNRIDLLKVYTEGKTKTTFGFENIAHWQNIYNNKEYYTQIASDITGKKTEEINLPSIIWHRLPFPGK